MIKESPLVPCGGARLRGAYDPARIVLDPSEPDFLRAQKSQLPERLISWHKEREGIQTMNVHCGDAGN
jgi:hypothetical protein